MQSKNNKPKLRDTTQSHSAPYPIGEIPDSVMYAVGKQLVHRHAIGMIDIKGDDFAEMFASAIGGVHRDQPLGIADVVWNKCAWSVKTVKSLRTFTQKKVRLISGRNSPAFSAGISDPLKDINATGRAVLEIWNERVAIAGDRCDDLRMIVLIRDPIKKHYTLFESGITRYVPTEYVWKQNAHGNLEGSAKLSGEHIFTWQPHGSQFTVIKNVPPSTIKFKIVKPPKVLPVEQIMKMVGYDDSWIEKV